MTDNTNKMNKRKAESIVKKRAFGPDFDAALEYLMSHAPNSPILMAYKEEQQNAIKNTIDETMDFVRNDRNEREVLGQANTELKSDEDVDFNLGHISAIMEDERFQQHLRLEANRDTVHINVENVDEKDNGKVLNEALEASKQEVLMFYARDKQFAFLDKEQQEKILRNGVLDVFNMKMAKAVAGSAVKQATPEQAMPGSKEFKAAQEQSLDAMRAALESYYTKKPVKVKPEQILTSTVVTSQAMDEYEADMRKDGLEASADTFNRRKEEYNEKRRGFWGKAFDMAKGVLKSMKENKAHILTDAAVVIGAGALAIAAPIASAGVLAAYFSGGSFAWQINDERRKLKANAKENEKANWTGFKGFMNARKNIMSDEKAKKKYYRQGTIGAIAGVAGAVLFGAGASAYGLAAGKIASGAARAAGSVANQGANWAMASREYKKNATEENKVARNTARTGFFVSAAASVIGSSIAAYFGLGHDAPEATTNSMPNLAENPGVDNPADTGSVAGADANGSDGIATDGADVAAHTVEVPTEWNENMGISEAHWNEMHRKITGIYADHADIFGKENVAPEEAMAKMYQNIENARGAGYFEGETNEQVLYKYMKLIENTERAEVLKGTQYLVSKLDENGEHMYWVNAEEMKALNKIIICGERTEVSPDNIGKVFTLINEKTGAYTGEGAGVGGSNSHYVGGRYGCGDNQNAWKFAAKHHHTPAPVPESPAKTPIEEVVVNQPKAPAHHEFEEVTHNEHIEPKAQEVNVTVTRFNTGDNTAASDTGSHSEKLVSRATYKGAGRSM